MPAEQQPCETRLSGAGRSDNRDVAPGTDGKVHFFQNSVARGANGDVLDTNGCRPRRLLKAFAAPRGFGLRQSLGAFGIPSTQKRQRTAALQNAIMESALIWFRGA